MSAENAIKSTPNASQFIRPNLLKLSKNNWDMLEKVLTKQLKAGFSYLVTKATFDFEETKLSECSVYWHFKDLEPVSVVSIKKLSKWKPILVHRPIFLLEVSVLDHCAVLQLRNSVRVSSRQLLYNYLSNEFFMFFGFSLHTFSHIKYSAIYQLHYQVRTRKIHWNCSWGKESYSTLSIVQYVITEFLIRVT